MYRKHVDYFLAIGFLSALTTTGCGGPKASTSDPVASFKRMADDFIKKYKESRHEDIFHVTGSEIANVPDGWRKEYFDLVSDEYKMDVRKTDSLVTPFLGILEFDSNRHVSAEFGTEDGAQAAIEFPDNHILNHHYTFVYQNDGWVLKSKQCRSPELTSEWGDCNNPGEP